MIVRPGRDLLSGRVEADETYLGGLEEGLSGGKTETKALIIIAAEADGMGVGRIRMRLIAEASAKCLHAFVQESIVAGSIVQTDGWAGYAGLTDQVMQGRKVALADGNTPGRGQP